MRPALRLIVLLIFAIALRGFSASAYAHVTPAGHPDAAAAMAAQMATQMPDCPDHAAVDPLPPAADHLQSGDKACQISCDLAAAPGLTAGGALPAAAVLAVFTATRRILALSAAAPPDHPPPIR